MNRKLIGNIGEAKVLSYFVEKEYQIYLPFQDNGEYDMLIVKDNLIQRVSIKSTSVKEGTGYRVELRTVSRRKDNKVTVKPFNPNTIDILAVYIQPLDKVVIIDSKIVGNKSALMVK